MGARRALRRIHRSSCRCARRDSLVIGLSAKDCRQTPNKKGCQRAGASINPHSWNWPDSVRRARFLNSFSPWRQSHDRGNLPITVLEKKKGVIQASIFWLTEDTMPILLLVYKESGDIGKAIDQLELTQRRTCLWYWCVRSTSILPCSRSE